MARAHRHDTPAVRGGRSGDGQAQSRSLRYRVSSLKPQQQDRVLSQIENPEIEAEAGTEQATAGFAPSTPAAMQQYETETDLDFFQMLACTDARASTPIPSMVVIKTM